jgi:hypothetical protein
VCIQIVFKNIKFSLTFTYVTKNVRLSIKLMLKINFYTKKSKKNEQKYIHNNIFMRVFIFLCRQTKQKENENMI